MEEPIIIDYTQNFDDLITELETVRELQVMHINNSIEMVSISFIFFGVLIACMLGLTFIKRAFRWYTLYQRQ